MIDQHEIIKKILAAGGFNSEIVIDLYATQIKVALFFFSLFDLRQPALPYHTRVARIIFFVCFPM